jgi:iron complex outermembrane recepter protein
MKPDHRQSRIVRNGEDVMAINRANLLCRVGFIALAQAAVAPAIAQEASTPPSDDIVITGIRLSTQQSINAKRLSDRIVDVITAEDIGKLPDQNIGESLQRVTGIQVNRRFGEVTGIQVRGLSQNRLEINGRTLVGSGANGDITFEDVSSELFAGVEVIKSPSANMTEGALGATVNLKTRQPLDFKDRLLAFSAQGLYAQNLKDHGLRASALYVDQIGDNFGFLVNLSYNKIVGREDFYRVSNYQGSSNLRTPGNVALPAAVLHPAFLEAWRNDVRFDRMGGNVAVQWKPSDSLEIVAEGSYFYTKKAETQFESQFRLDRTNSDRPANVGRPADPVFGLAPIVQSSTTSTRFANLLETATLTNVLTRSSVQNRPDSQRTYSFSVGANYDGGGRLRLAASFGGSGGKTDRNDQSLRLFALTNQSVSYDLTTAYDGTSSLPQVTFRGPGDLLSPTAFGGVQGATFSSAQDRIQPRFNSSYEGRFDLDYDVDLGPISTLQAGVRFAREKFRESRSDANFSAFTQFDRNGDGAATINELPAVEVAVVSDFFGSRNGGRIPSTFVVPRITSGSAYTEAYRLNPGLPLVFDAIGSSDVAQDTLAGYVQADLKGNLGVPFSGNVGMRVVKTDRTSRGFASNAAGVLTPISPGAKFTEWLPSANINFELTSNLNLRFAVAEVISRPSLDLVRPGIRLPNPGASGDCRASAGNPALTPFKATQYDASLEWYFAKASLLSAAVFHKEVGAFIVRSDFTEAVPANVNTTCGTLIVSRPVNGSKGKVQGFELNYQHALTFLPSPLDGLGVSANYTYARSDTPLINSITNERLPLPNLSRHSYNLVGYFEKYGFGARVAYNWRSSAFLDTAAANQGGPRLARPYGQLDLSVNYDISKNISVSLEAFNVTDAVQRVDRGFEGLFNDATRSERRIFFGVRARI